MVMGANKNERRRLATLAAQVPPPVWFWVCSLALLLVAVCLFAASASFGAYRSRLSGLLMPALVVSLALAAVLHIAFLLQVRRNQREAASALHTVDCEFTSVFIHALDGILVLDNEGRCLDANPAACGIFRVPRGALVGQTIAKFYVEAEEYARHWTSFLKRKYQRGSIQFRCGDNATVFVDYASVADYIPGRHLAILCDTTERVRAEHSLRQSEDRFQRMANNIQEVFWMMEAQTKHVVYVNPAYEAITGRTVSGLYDNPLSYQEVIYPADRSRVLARLEDAVSTGTFDEEIRIVRSDGIIRWVWVKASAVRDAGSTRWLVGTAQDITTRKRAELQIAGHVASAEAARAEAEALRKSTLALTQNLAMDVVLDTLLQCLADLVPYHSASVLLAEGGTRLLVAREAPSVKRNFLTLDARENFFLEKVLMERTSVLLLDTQKELEWREIKLLAGIRSWIAVPLAASGTVLGLLSIGARQPLAFAPEHLRLAKSLAIPAAVAIQNARLFERAEIYAAELELRLEELKQAQRALADSESRSRGSGA
jgi:PAS domain S-box-containing protein